MDRFDVRTAFRDLYRPSAKHFSLVDVPAMRYLAVDGSGDPNTSPEHAAAVRALYAVAYGIKFAARATHGRDIAVAPLEGLWRADDPGAFVRRDKHDWRWTMLIHQPDWITEDDVAAARERAAAKADPATLGRLRLLELREGSSVQILHIGPYDDEGPTLEELHDRFMPEHGLTWNGDHHEIYLGDPRRAAPERLRTVLRQPVRPVQ